MLDLAASSGGIAGCPQAVESVEVNLLRPGLGGKKSLVQASVGAVDLFK